MNKLQTLLLLVTGPSRIQGWASSFAPVPVPGPLPTGDRPSTDDYVHVENKCITGNNMKKYTGISVSECTDHCSADASCFAIEYTQTDDLFSYFSTDRDAMDCHLQSSAHWDDCLVDDGNNLDLYIKKNTTETMMGLDGYWTHSPGTEQQWVYVDGIVLQLAHSRNKFVAQKESAGSGLGKYWTIGDWWLVQVAPQPVWRLCKRAFLSGRPDSRCIRALNRSGEFDELYYIKIDPQEFNDRKTECSGGVTTGDLCCDYDKPLDQKHGCVGLSDIRSKKIKSLAQTQRRAEELHNTTPFPTSCQLFEEAGLCSHYPLAAKQFCSKECGLCHAKLKTMQGCVCQQRYSVQDPYPPYHAHIVEDGTCHYWMPQHYYWCKVEPGCASSYYDPWNMYSWDKCGFEGGLVVSQL